MSTQALFQALNDSALNHINFSAFGVTINRLAYIALVQRIVHDEEKNDLGLGDEKVRVRVNMAMPAGAEAIYNQSCNTIFVPYHGYGGHQHEQGTLVHEASHAILDMFQANHLVVRDDEVIAYLAEAFYLIGRKAPPDRRPGSPHRVAWETARAKLAPNTARAPSSLLTFSPQELAGLQRAVQNHTLYQREALQRSANDGVSGNSRC